ESKTTRGSSALTITFPTTTPFRAATRSEERRVGKECRSRRSPDHEKKKIPFDEKGHADNQERKVELISRSFRLLPEVGVFASVHIICDAHICAIASCISGLYCSALSFL